jgi:hypothetical protein
MSLEQEHDHEGYDGPAELVTDDGTLEVRVTVRGVFQPIDGRYHWYGRVAPDDRVVPWGRAGASVVLRTPEGSAAGRLSDEDPWGRYRIAGTGRPPFVTTA